jgi:hypothetical protein
LLEANGGNFQCFSIYDRIDWGDVYGLKTSIEVATMLWGEGVRP